jgi:sulfoxide reductase heme-binding subunit YedZ
MLAIALHALTLLADPWLHPGVGGITLPFAIDYRPAFVAMGIVGGYLALALGLGFYLRRWIGPKRWRTAHRFVIVAWALAFVHTLGAGTDAATPWLRTPMIAVGALVAALFAFRVGASALKSRRRRMPPPRPTPQPAQLH